ncbi:MAG: HDOD domain-containing protein [Desulfobulbus sp.]|jgi:putative nucleotidyltransferase with HDIG domain|uniref:HDOD domain-containing protein n=1 Tax=Desulfobulbus sp. TaxID=895 RepID=UPI00284DC6E0|nr:HDOD domain-containing protein [Desulfobulbus sp.]MDR2549499.1 HDOD domain-containing protein [Desulfobulbus sp.]
MSERKTKLEKIRAFVDKMPSLSTTVSKVLEICSRTDTSPNDLNKVISLDPVLTGQVLKLINSAYYSLVNKVTSLTRAIIMLGLNTVKNLALSTAVIRCVGQAKKSKALPIKDFWAHSIGVGVMAKLLAAERGLPLAEREEYFVAGLLHDLGKIPFGDEYIEVLAQAKNEQLPLIHLEKQCLEIDHEEVGEMIASNWRLNPVITDAICHHHSPEQAAPEHQALVATVALADFYICLFDIGYAGNRYPDEEQLPTLLAMCDLEWSAVVGLSGLVDEEIQKAEIFLQV